MPIVCLSLSRYFFLSLLVSVTVVVSAVGETAAPTTEDAMARAVNYWLAKLSPELRTAAQFSFGGPEREAWHFIPKERLGVSLLQMDLDERRAAHNLIRTALSNRGYLKATAIMSLEEILRTIERDRPNVEQIRHPAKYWFAVFGDPKGEEPWGWRVEGHHLSLNFAVIPGKGIAASPAFYGANPAEIRTGHQAGLRVLGEEEDLARELLAALSPELQAQAVIDDKAPPDVITGPGASLDLGEPTGLSAKAMTKSQQKTLRNLVSEVANNLCGEVATKQTEEIADAGWEDVWFAWAGSRERGAPHYFRLHGPTFIVEYDNTQNDANHIHLVWHSTSNDFGADLLRQHYEESPHHRVKTAADK